MKKCKLSLVLSKINKYNLFNYLINLLIFFLYDILFNRERVLLVYMEEIDLKELWNLFKTKLVKIIIFTLVIVLFGAIYVSFIKVPEYKSSSTVVLSTSGTSSITYTDVNVNNNLVSTYSEIAKSRSVLQESIDELNLDIDYESLAKKVSVSQVSDTEIITITVSNKDAETARILADKIAEIFTSRIKDIYNMDNVRVLDNAVKADTPYNINFIKTLTICALVGLLLGFAYVFILYTFDTTIKTPEEVEMKLQLPILGRIPEEKRGKRK